MPMAYSPPMNANSIEKTRPVPIRLSKEMRTRLDSAAARFCTTRSGILRLAIDQLLPDLELGRIVIKKPASNPIHDASTTANTAS